MSTSSRRSLTDLKFLARTNSPCDIDWSALLQTALSHGVMPLLYRSLSTTCPDAIPKVFLEQLRDAFYANAAHNALLAKELLKILHLLEIHGIPALPFKGPVLAASVFGNLALRQFGDLDILIREQDAERARETLLSNGYRRLTQISAAHAEAFHRARKVYELVRQDEKVLVELHWAITSWTFFFPLNPEHLWERLETGSLEDTPVRTVATEDLLLLLCVHGAKHYWSKLGWICDVAELLRVYPGLTWKNVLLHSKQLGARRILFVGLFLAHVLLGANLPKEIWKEIDGDTIVPQLADKVQARLFAVHHGETSAVHDPIFYLKLRERLRERIACALYLAYVRLPGRLKTALLLSAHQVLAGLNVLRPRFRKTICSVRDSLFNRFNNVNR
jgi:Uncharacterised nucleotidyltransferase